MNLHADISDARRTAAEARGHDQGMRIVSYLLSGMVCYGGLGWIVDHFLGTRVGVMVGLLFGTAVSIWMVIKRYGGAA